MATQAQIANLQVSIIIDEDVSWFQVTVHDSLAVHVLECTRHLVNKSPNLLLGKADFVFHCSLEDELEVALLGPLDGNEKLVQLVVDEPAQVFHYVRMI